MNLKQAEGNKHQKLEQESVQLKTGNQERKIIQSKSGSLKDQ